jgi:hypothetical protein
METAFAIVTLISLAVAVTMTAVTIRLLRQERRRSDARVASLAMDAADLPLRPDDRAAPLGAATQPLFTVEPTRAGRFGRIAAVVVLGAIVVGGTGFLLTRLGTPTSAEPTVAASAPLELLALRHERQADGLKISGTVRNPAGAAPARDVTAVAFLFDRDGTFLMSGRAPLDITAIGPGEESPFVIAVAAPAAASRYRISFRAAGGGVVTHVDRREQGLGTRD